MILQLAVQGKLVAQDASDEPAAVLLEKIQAEKERLIREGTIKRQKPLPAMTEAEKPFALPEGWEWVRLGELISVMDSGWSPACLDHPSPSESIWGVLKTTSVQNMKFLEYENKELPSKLEPKPQYEVQAGDILITRAGPKNRVGISCLVESTRNKLMISDKIIRFHLLLAALSERYIVLCLHAGATAKYLEEAKSGMAESQVNISQEKLKLAPVPLCPDLEQLRIIGKVNALLSLCDQLEALQTQRAQLQTTTNQALLEQLSNAQSPLDLQNAWQRLQTHLPKLFTQPEHIKGLRDAILQLAVQGKLVPQDANDEPAAVLLAKIKAEKERLVQAGKIKRQKPLPAITEEEKPFALPQGWECIHFADFAQEVSTGPFGSMIHKSDYIENGIPLINPSHMMNDQIKADFSISVSPEKAEELSSYKIYKGDIVISRRGEMGRCALVDEKSDGWLCGTGSFFIRFDQRINRDFILLLFKSKLVREYLGGNSVGTTMTNLNHSILNRMPMLLPPEKEILKILQKVHSLMQLCDQLESHLKSARHTQEQFARAAVALE
ncbi:MAG: restriction endonuclease subunit S [Thiolinea sp.]